MPLLQAATEGRGGRDALVPERGRDQSVRLELLADHVDDLDRQTKPAGDVLARPVEMRDPTEHEQMKLAQVRERGVRHPVIQPVCPLSRQIELVAPGVVTCRPGSEKRAIHRGYESGGALGSNRGPGDYES